MKVKIIKIGNSKGIRIPKSVLEQYEIKEEAVLEMKKDGIAIKPDKKNVRHGWDKAFRNMHKKKHDKPVIRESIDTDGDWEWK